MCYKSASCSKGIMSKIWTSFKPFFKDFPGWFFANEKVFVIWFFDFIDGRWLLTVCTRV